VRPNDASIGDDVWLLRALPYEGWYKTNEQGTRATSLGFTDNRTGEVSCYIDSPERRRRLRLNYQTGFIARVLAADIRAQGFNITCDPAGDPERSPEHVVLTFGQEGVSKSKIQKAAGIVALAAQILIDE
jgi:hypothetical protein